MHLFTDSKAAHKEAVARPSERVSALELANRAVTEAFGLDHARRMAIRGREM
jgi:hypothetical protein